MTTLITARKAGVRHDAAARRTFRNRAALAARHGPGGGAVLRCQWRRAPGGSLMMAWAEEPGPSPLRVAPRPRAGARRRAPAPRRHRPALRAA